MGLCGSFGCLEVHGAEWLLRTGLVTLLTVLNLDLTPQKSRLRSTAISSCWVA